MPCIVISCHDLPVSGRVAQVWQPQFVACCYAWSLEMQLAQLNRRHPHGDADHLCRTVSHDGTCNLQAPHSEQSVLFETSSPRLLLTHIISGGVAASAGSLNELAAAAPSAELALAKSLIAALAAVTTPVLML